MSKTDDRFVFLAEIMERTGWSRAKIYADIKGGFFPPLGNTNAKAGGMWDSELQRMQALLMVNASKDALARLTQAILEERARRARDVLNDEGEGI